MADEKIIRHAHLGPLHDLLIAACPPCVKENGRYVKAGPNTDGVKSTHALAALLDMSEWGVHQWIKRGKVPPKRAAQIVALGSNRVTLAEFSPFIYV
jgi:hypothetical protein